VNLDATFFSSKNASEAASKLVLVVNKFEILKDAYYVNSRPKAEVLARLLQTHLAQELQQLQQPAADSEVLVVSDFLCSSDSCILPEHSSHSLPGDQPAIALHAVGVSSICSAQILLPWQHEGLLVAHMACSLLAQ
jgi:hypothetical protein